MPSELMRRFGHRERLGKKDKDVSSPVLIWGLHPVHECLAARPEAAQRLLVHPSFGRKPGQRQLLAQAERVGLKVARVTDLSCEGVPPEAVHQGVALWLWPFWWKEFNELPHVWEGKVPLVVACDQVTDPQNLGAIIRSAAAFGAQAVVVPERRTVSVTGAVVKASVGAIAHLAVVEVGNLVRALVGLKEHGLWVAGLTPEGSNLLWEVDLSIPLVLTVGAEGPGVRPLVKRTCDILLTIPLAGSLASLNVAAAAAVALYETARQRREAAVPGGVPVIR